MSPNKRLHEELFGLPFLNLPSDQAAQHILELLDTPSETSDDSLPLVLFTPNPEQLVMSFFDQRFRAILAQGDLFLLDGVGISLIAKLRGRSVHRTPGRVVVTHLLEQCANHAIPVMFLGGKPGIAEKAFLKIQVHLPRLRGVGIAGSPDVENETETEFSEVLSLIRKHTIQMIFVGFGAPTQEAWCVRHRGELREAGVRVVMAVGGVFDVLAGEIAQPPVFVSNLGFEWVWRLVHQPWRWKRQLRLLFFPVLALIGFRVR